MESVEYCTNSRNYDREKVVSGITEHSIMTEATIQKVPEVVIFIKRYYMI